jgi:hypothetical protein
VPYAAETGHALSLLHRFTALVKHFLELKLCFARFVSLLNQLLNEKILP